jgi:hypothetical protein
MMRFSRLPDSRKSESGFRCFEDFIASEFDSDKDFEGFLDMDTSDIELSDENSDENSVILLEKFSFRFE